VCVASAHGVGGTSSRMAWEARPRLCPRARVHVCVCLCVFGAVGVQKKIASAVTVILCGVIGLGLRV